MTSLAPNSLFFQCKDGVLSVNVFLSRMLFVSIFSGRINDCNNTRVILGELDRISGRQPHVSDHMSCSVRFCLWMTSLDDSLRLLMSQSKQPQLVVNAHFSRLKKIELNSYFEERCSDSQKWTRPVMGLFATIR